MKPLFKPFIPFILFGIAIITFVLGIMLLTYIFIFGALIGLVLMLISRIREKFFPTPTTLAKKPKKYSGRTIDAE